MYVYIYIESIYYIYVYMINNVYGYIYICMMHCHKYVYIYVYSMHIPYQQQFNVGIWCQSMLICTQLYSATGWEPAAATGLEWPLVVALAAKPELRHGRLHLRLCQLGKLGECFWDFRRVVWGHYMCL